MHSHSSQWLPNWPPSSLASVRWARAASCRPSVISSSPTVSAAHAMNGSFCWRKPSSAVDAACSAPSKSSTIGRIHETASCAALSRYGIVDAPLEPLDPLERGQRAVVVTNLDCGDGRDQQQLGLRAVVQCVGSEQQLLDPGPALGHAIPHLPEQPEDRGRCAAAARCRGVKNQRMATPRFPSSVRNRSAHSACRSAGQSAFSTSAPKYSACRRSTSAQVRAGGKALGGQLPYGCEHAEPRPGVGRVDAHQAVPGERIEQIERPVLGEIGNVHGRLERPAVDEDRQRGQHLLLGVIEQPDAPFDGRAQRALTFGKVDRAGTQRVEADFRAERAMHPGSSRRVRAAASSMASGRPSRRRQISTTASALSSVKAKS